MRKTIIIIFWLGLNGLSQGQSLDEYLEIAAEANPELKAYFSDYLAAMEKVPQVGALPDPEVSMGFFLQPMERLMGNQQAEVKLMQMFPWFGMLRTRKDEAGKMALARYEIFQDAKNRLFFQVKNIWYQIYQLEEEIRISEEHLKILQSYERLALTRFQSAGGMNSSSEKTTDKSSMKTPPETSSSTSMGNMGGGINTGNRRAMTGSGNTPATMPSGMGSGQSGMSDVLRARMEIKELENSLALLKDSRTPLQVEFNQLLNRNIHEEIKIADSLKDTAISIERLALLDSITQNNPMLKMFDAEEKAYEYQQEMARLEGMPMVGAGINYMAFSPRTEDGMSMGGKDMVMPMISISIPIYRKKYKAMVKEAELKQKAVQQRRENSVNQLSTQWATAIRDLDDATRQTTLYQEQTELARQTMNLLMTSYSSEGREFEEVLRVQQQLLDFQLKLVSAIVNQHSTVAMLEMLTATDGLMER